MLLQVSQKLVSIWRQERLIPSNNEEIYVYGVQLLLATALNTSCIILVSCLAQRYFAWLPILFGFIPFRVTSGGYHARTPLTCTLMFCGFYLAVMIAVENIQPLYLDRTLLFNSIISFVTVLICSPIPASNKPLTEPEKKRNRLLSLTLASSLLLIVVFALKLSIELNVLLYITFGELMAAAFLALGWISMTIRKVQENK